jgi:hypothetical protein
MSTPNKILTALADANGVIALGLQVGAVVVPLVKGVIKEIRAIGSGTETVSYEIVVQADLAELDAVDKLASDDLAAINLELKVRGIPEIPIPPPATGS